MQFPEAVLEKSPPAQPQERSAFCSYTRMTSLPNTGSTNRSALSSYDVSKGVNPLNELALFACNMSTNKKSSSRPPISQESITHPQNSMSALQLPHNAPAAALSALSQPPPPPPLQIVKSVPQTLTSSSYTSSTSKTTEITSSMGHKTFTSSLSHSNTTIPMETSPPSSPIKIERRKSISVSRKGVATFVQKLWEIVNTVEYVPMISWSSDGRCIIVHDEIELVKQVFPHFFKTALMASFVRQLNMYHFVKQGVHKWHHPSFSKGQKHLLGLVTRHKHGNNPPCCNVSAKNFSLETSFSIKPELPSTTKYNKEIFPLQTARTLKMEEPSPSSTTSLYDAPNNGSSNSKSMTSLQQLTSSKRRNDAPKLPPFLTHLFEIVSDEETDYIVRWSDGGTALKVLDSREMERKVLLKYFKHSTFSSFTRQLNMYSFHKCGYQQWRNPNFIKGHQEMLHKIIRKRAKTTTIVMQTSQTTSHSQQQRQQEEELDGLKKAVTMERQRRETAECKVDDLKRELQDERSKRIQLQDILTLLIPTLPASMIQQMPSSIIESVMSQKSRMEGTTNNYECYSSHYENQYDAQMMSTPTNIHTFGVQNQCSSPPSVPTSMRTETPLSQALKMNIYHNLVDSKHRG